ncbi:MAG: hypothetical protein ACREEM_48265 [Blastocatellia bacterium]
MGVDDHRNDAHLNHRLFPSPPQYSEDFPGLPFHARIERDPDGNPLVHHNEEWAAISFYHPPECVPPNFNLLDFFDFGALNCPTTVQGFLIFRSLDISEGPRQLEVRALGAVPIWFVRWPVLQAAIADNVLTIGELAGLSTLIKGSADFFHEITHPGIAGPGQLDNGIYAASGTLADGRRFQFESTELGWRIIRTRIVFR